MFATPMSDRFFENSFKIEKMRAENVAAVMQIEAENNLSSWGKDGFNKEIENRDAVLLVCLDNKSNEAIGFVFGRLITPEMEILNIAVGDKFKRKGIGAALLRAVLDVGAEKKCEKCWLEVRETNFRVRAFYKKFGFVEAGKRKNYYARPSEDAVLLRFDFKNLPCGKSFD